MQMMRSAWEAVTAETIGNCWRHAGFRLEGDEVSSALETDSDLTELSDQLRTHGIDVDTDSYVAVDSQLHTAGVLSTREIEL